MSECGNVGLFGTLQARVDRMAAGRSDVACRHVFDQSVVFLIVDIFTSGEFTCIWVSGAFESWKPGRRSLIGG